MRHDAASTRLGTTRTLLKERGSGASIGSTVRRTVLPGGLRVITEAMPGARSATVGIWTGTGSRDEPLRLAGVTHFLEHLLFKGTRRRTSLEISAALDAVGGELNAFTGKEFTCYHARVLGDDVPLALDVLCDMVTSAAIPSREVENERRVILDEIAMHDDDPDDVVQEAFESVLFGDAPLGRSITGTAQSVASLSRRQIHGYFRRRYTADTLVVAVAGRVDHGSVVRLVYDAFEAAGALGDPSRSSAGLRAVAAPTPVSAGGVLLEHPFEQATFMLGVPACTRDDPRRFALGVLNAALGGGTSSRLFQEVREVRGLAYTIESFTVAYADGGFLAVSGACLPGRIADVIDICREELSSVAVDGLTDAEVERGKGQLRGSLVIALEDTGARMTRIGRSELVAGELLSIDDSLARIDAVTPDDVREVASDLLFASPTFAVVGPEEALSLVSP